MAQAWGVVTIEVAVIGFDWYNARGLSRPA